LSCLTSHRVRFCDGHRLKKRANEQTRTADLLITSDNNSLPGVAHDCESRIDKRFFLFRIAACCTVLRSRWCQWCQLRRLQDLQHSRFRFGGRGGPVVRAPRTHLPRRSPAEKNNFSAAVHRTSYTGSAGRRGRSREPWHRLFGHRDGLRATL
jgi:hypothetical protein